MTLKDAKRLNLNDEVKGGIVKALTKHLKMTIEENIVKEKCDGMEREKELIASLNSFKSNCREECAQCLLNLLNKSSIIDVTNKQITYGFGMFEILFNSAKIQKNDKILKLYTKFCDKYILVKGKVTDIDLLCGIFNAHITLLKSSKEHLEFCIIDEVFTFFIDQRNRPCLESVEDFCKFYDVVGQFLFIIGNFHQRYFKSRIPQYFNAYKKFSDAIYYFKHNTNDELNEKEISMLLKLTLQLEK